MGLFSRAVDRMVSEKVPHKRRRRMIVFVAILTLLSMVTSTVAWFSVNTFAGAAKGLHGGSRCGFVSICKGHYQRDD